MVDGVKCGPDGVRCDVNGNVWISSNAGRAVGYSGVTVWSPEGKLNGRTAYPKFVATPLRRAECIACSWRRASGSMPCTR